MRLSRPPMTALPVYNVLIRCWLVEPDARPTFIDLKSDFSKFALDPKKYIRLKVKNDLKYSIMKFYCMNRILQKNANKIDNDTFVTINQEMDVELMKKLVYEDRKSYYSNIMDRQNGKQDKDEERINKSESSNQMMVTFKRKPQLHQMEDLSSYINTDSPIVDSVMMNEDNEKSSESHVITFKKLPKKMDLTSNDTLQFNESQEKNGDKS